VHHSCSVTLFPCLSLFFYSTVLKSSKYRKRVVDPSVLACSLSLLLFGTGPTHIYQYSLLISFYLFIINEKRGLSGGFVDDSIRQSFGSHGTRSRPRVNLKMNYKNTLVVVVRTRRVMFLINERVKSKHSGVLCHVRTRTGLSSLFTPSESIPRLISDHRGC